MGAGSWQKSRVRHDPRFPKHSCSGAKLRSTATGSISAEAWPLPDLVSSFRILRRSCPRWIRRPDAQSTETYNASFPAHLNCSTPELRALKHEEVASRIYRIFDRAPGSGSFLCLVQCFSGWLLDTSTKPLQSKFKLKATRASDEGRKSPPSHVAHRTCLEGIPTSSPRPSPRFRI